MELVLVHIGIDTVGLEGSPFEVFVSEGDKVTKDTLLANVDLEALKELEKSDTVIIVFTNMDDVDDFTIDHNGSQTHGEVIGSVTAK